MGRIEAAKQIRQVVPGTKLIFLTLNNDPEVVRAALSSGARGYVLKTDAGTELWPAIEAVLQGKQYVSSGVAGRDPAGADRRSGDGMVQFRNTGFENLLEMLASDF